MDDEQGHPHGLETSKCLADRPKLIPLLHFVAGAGLEALPFPREDFVQEDQHVVVVVAVVVVVVAVVVVAAVVAVVAVVAVGAAVVVVVVGGGGGGVFEAKHQYLLL